MNRQRVVQLLRALADEFESEDEAPANRPPAKRRAPIVVPDNDVVPDPLTAARADRLLRRAGVAPR